MREYCNNIAHIVCEEERLRGSSRICLTKIGVIAMNAL